MPTDVDRELGEILRGFESRMGAADSPPVEIGVKVRRTARFTNRAVGASGHEIIIDEPVVFGGGGTEADPAEHLLAAVGASLSVTITAHAALRGLALESVEVALNAELDERSFFAPRRWPRAGMQETRIDLALTGPISARAARSLVAESLRASPVLRSLKRRPKVDWTLKRSA